MKSLKEQKLICPFCGGEKLHKDGFAYMAEGKVQQYQCSKCHRRTTKPTIRKDKKEL